MAPSPAKFNLRQPSLPRRRRPSKLANSSVPCRDLRKRGRRRSLLRRVLPWLTRRRNFAPSSSVAAPNVRLFLKLSRSCKALLRRLAAPARAAAPAAAPVAAASATAAPAAPAAVSAAPAVASSDVKAKLSNPAALQRGWQTALADLKRQRAAYGALLLSARIVAEPDASGIAIEFRPRIRSRFLPPRNPTLPPQSSRALSASFGGPVPFRVTQGSAAGGAASVASASAPAPAAPAAPAAVHRGQQSVRAQAPSAGLRAKRRRCRRPHRRGKMTWCRTPTPISLPTCLKRSSPFTEPDASLTVGGAVASGKPRPSLASLPPSRNLRKTILRRKENA